MAKTGGAERCRIMKAATAANIPTGMQTAQHAGLPAGSWETAESDAQFASRTITFTVPGEPQGKARPRVTRNGTFTPRKTAEYERRVRAAYREQCGDIFLGDSALIVTIAARFEPPKSVSRKKRAAMLAGLIHPKRKPDADNIAKSICDALNGIAYRDDAQITCLIVEKQYSDRAGVTVDIAPREVTA